MKMVGKAILTLAAVAALSVPAMAADKLMVNNSGGTTVFKVNDAGTITSSSSSFAFDSVNNRIGIGTSTPAQQLHLFQDSISLNPTVMVDSVGDAAGVKGQFMFKRARGSVATGLKPMLSGDFLAQFALQGYNGGTTNGGYDGARRIFQIEASENWDATHGGFSYAFSTRPNGSVGVPVEAVRFNQNGIVGIGTGTNIAVSGTGKLEMAGDTIRIDSPRTPAQGSTCNTGEISWDASYIYVCTAANTWRRSALAAY